MKIVVCVKQTPDTAATVTVEDGRVSWGDSPLVLNPWDEYAVEEAIKTKEAHGGTVTAISLGPERAQEVLKQALAMGADEAVLIHDQAFEGADVGVVSVALAMAVGKIGEVDLVFFGRASVDSAAGLTFAQTARHLGWPLLSQVAAIEELDPSAGKLQVVRLLQEGRQIVGSPLPAVVSVVKEINEPRYPSFMGIRKASKAEIPSWGATELGLEAALEPRVIWPSITQPAKVETTCEFIDGESAAEKGRRLAQRLIEEKVI